MVEAFGLNVPLPPLHMALDAPPPNVPASWTLGDDEQTVRSAPALTEAAGAMVIFIWSLAWPQGPLTASLVSVSVTEPAAISAAVGVYVAFMAVALGLNVPAPPLHEPVEAPPPITPASCTCGALAHTVTSRPAFAVAAGA